ncbi:PLP-dependent aminotransferase family protein [Paludibacterium yongneupense]|uniref:aminotransferase-like domain-containing protein n=1 Tax=Paludibacterium yongneupense TaxID=400061 RepID=UPI00041C2BAB|nr:PLP-dependent aminotransferase family protein [Paludibacterium yongneupense]
MKNNDLPLYQQLADAIAVQIKDGILRPGERLPSLREMRMRRGLSLSTVQEAFRRLEDRGLVQARPQSGYFVSPRAVFEPVPHPTAPGEVEVDALLWNYVKDLYEVAPGHVDGFRNAHVLPGLLPVAALQKLTIDCVRSRPGLLSDYGVPAGDAGLRRQIARQALEWDGQISPDNLIITQGTIEALNLALRALTRPGDVVAVESPAYFSLLYCLKALGLRVVEIPTDPVCGISVDALELATRDGAVQAVILVANFSNPLGSLMPDSAKQRVADLLASRDIPLIEDDVYGEFYFGKHRPRPIKAFDRSGNVLYCSSMTKSVAPGLRVGWIEAGRHQASIEVQKYIGTHSTPLLNQVVLARFLEDGGYARHMRRMRRTLAAQMRAVAAGVERYFPEDTRFSLPGGGCVLWLQLPSRFDSIAFYLRAREEGIGVAPGPLFSPRGGYRNCVRLSYAAPCDAVQLARLARLGELARMQLDGRL